MKPKLNWFQRLSYHWFGRVPKSWDLRYRGMFYDEYFDYKTGSAIVVERKTGVILWR